MNQKQIDTLNGNIGGARHRAYMARKKYRRNKTPQNLMLRTEAVMAWEFAREEKHKALFR